MKKEDFIGLIHKYNLGETSEEEQQFLMSYYHLFDTEPDVLALLNEKQKNALKKEIHDSIWKRINFHGQQRRRAKSKTGLRVKISAAVVLLVLCITAITYYLLRPSEVDTIVIKVEIGKKNQVVRLPDGSTALVYAGSRLTFPSTFEGLQRREVNLEGKAYFDVKRNSSKRFVIHTEDIKTTVLGTAFTIEAYPAHKNISINVIRGRVEVSNRCKILGVLAKGDKLICNKEMADIVQEPMEKVQQDLLMDDVSLAESIVFLEKQFKVSIDCRGKSLLEQRFTTTFRKEESLEQVLNSICEFIDADFHFDKKRATVIVYSKTK